MDLPSLDWSRRQCADFIKQHHKRLRDMTSAAVQSTGLQKHQYQQPPEQVGPEQLRHSRGSKRQCMAKHVTATALGNAGSGSSSGQTANEPEDRVWSAHLADEFALKHYAAAMRKLRESSGRLSGTKLCGV